MQYFGNLDVFIYFQVYINFAEVLRQDERDRLRMLLSTTYAAISVDFCVDMKLSDLCAILNKSGVNPSPFFGPCSI